MFAQLIDINSKPKPFEFYNAETLWNDPHRSKKMLEYHLNENVDISSRKKAFIEKSIHWIVTKFSVKNGTKTCDFGCGPGFYTLGLALQGASVTGIDFSRHSIEYARKTANNQGVSIRYVIKNYLEYETVEKYDLITMIMCDFCALSPQQRRTLLQKFHNMLKDGGSVLFDVYSLNAFNKKVENATYQHQQQDGFWTNEDYFEFVNTFKYPKEKVILEKFSIIEKNRTWQVYNWLQYFSLESLPEELHDCGFHISESLADVAGSAYQEESEEFAVIMQKD